MSARAVNGGTKRARWSDRRHRFRKDVAQLSRRRREDGVFRFIHSGSRFQKVAVSEAETLVHERLRVDETAKRLKTCAVSPEIVSVWMWPQRQTER